jgi:phospholipid/cholesterol/gamma-HCH transport system substrate-binding protein
MEYRRSEVGAGIFILVSFIILALMIFAVSDIQSLFKKKKEIKVLFQYSDGIEKNAPVRYSGIKIGKVTNIRMAPEFGDKVELTLSIYRDAIIKEDTRAAIKTQGLVGDKYVELSGGSPQMSVLEPGKLLIGEESFKLEDLTKAGLELVTKMKGIANNIDRIANNIDRMTGDPATTASIKTILHNLQDTSANLEVMTSSKDEVAQGLKNLPEMLKKLEDLTTVILKKLEDSSTNLKAVTEKTDTMLGDNKKKIDDTLDNIKQMTQNLKETSEDVKSHPWKLLRKP